MWERQTLNKPLHVVWIRAKKGDYLGSGSNERERNLIFRGC